MRKIMNTVYIGIIMNNKEWYIIDAKQAVLGRLASKIATLLKGKHKPTYLPHEDNGDYVVVVNAKNLNVTGNKLEDKVYYKHTGYEKRPIFCNYECSQRYVAKKSTGQEYA